MNLELDPAEATVIGGALIGAGTFLTKFIQWVTGSAIKRRDADDDAFRERERTLAAREAEYDAKLERRLSDLESGLEACKAREEKAEQHAKSMNAQLKRVLAVQDRQRRVITLFGDEMHKLSPGNPVIETARAILNAAFPIDPDLPAEWDELWGQLDGIPKVTRTRTPRSRKGKA